MNHTIIDRRKNPGSKSITNRQKFLERTKEYVKKAVEKVVQGDDYKIGEGTGDVEINVSTDGITEPTFSHEDHSGEYDFILTGNDRFDKGDVIEKPKSGKGKGHGGSPNGEGEDDFSFILSEKEFLDILFSELELPDLIKKSEKAIEHYSYKRGGYTTSGNPSNLNLVKTAISSLSRRIALINPKKELIAELEAEFLIADDKRKQEILLEIEELKAKASSIAFLEDVDIKYNSFVKYTKPITQAVMFLILDVSGSMGEREKLIAKKFFILLNLFLKRQYKHIDIVFIRHTTEAKECDEQEFFYSKEQGGTIVSSAYKLVQEIINTKYSDNDYNIYLAQASDGDNFDIDNKVCEKVLYEIFPKLQFMVYLEIANNDEILSSMFSTPSLMGSSLWQLLQPMESIYPLACTKVFSADQVASVFIRLFKKRA